MALNQKISLAHSSGLGSRLIRWLDRDRVFKWVPFVPVEAFFLLLIGPFILLIYLSLISWRVTRGPWWTAPFTGFSNFLYALGNGRFFDALVRTFAFAAIAVPIELILGLLLALLAYREFRGRRFYSTAFLVPMMIVPAVVGYDFSMILVDTGPLNQLLSLLAGRNINIRWLSEHTAAQAAIIGADIWQWTPLMFLILLSGLVGIPKEPIAAAKVFGASRWQIFWRIQLPLLKPVIAIGLVIRSMEALKIFDYPMLLTQGGPGNATETLPVYLYRMGWEFFRVSEAAAMSIILLIITAIYIAMAIRVIMRERGRMRGEG